MSSIPPAWKTTCDTIVYGYQNGLVQPGPISAILLNLFYPTGFRNPMAGTPELGATQNGIVPKIETAIDDL